MKQPRKIEYPNTRSHRASYGQLTDLQKTANQHYDSAYNLEKNADESLKKSGWGKNYINSDDGANLHNLTKDNLTYDPYKNKMYSKDGTEVKEIPEVLKNYHDSLQKSNEQYRLGDLAWASDAYGRDLYHDKDFRSGKRNYEKELSGHPTREGYDFQTYTDDDLYNLEMELGARQELIDPYGFGMNYDQQEAYDDYTEQLDAISKELERRKKERGE